MQKLICVDDSQQFITDDDNTMMEY